MANKIATKLGLDNGVQFTFADKNSTVRNFDLGELSKGMIKLLAIHGLKQKLGDSYAGEESVTTAIQGIDSIWSALKAGNFNTRVGGSSILAEAIARIKGITVEEAVGLLGSLEEEKLESVRKNPQVKAMVVVIRGERASSIANSEQELDI